MLWFKYKYILTVGVAFIGVKPDNNDIVSANALSNYSYVNARDSISQGIQIARCVTGMGPSGTDDNTALGRCYFNGTRKPFLKCQDSSAIIQPNVAGRLTGVINILQCIELTTDVEGIYTCVLLNSLMINESIRFGVYFTGRSELLRTFIIHNYHIMIAYLTLLYTAAPVIDTLSPSIVTVILGSPLTLSCTSRGSPPDTFTWRKNNDPTVLQSTSITAVDYTNTNAVFRANYSIDNVTTSDSGTYICTVTNPIGCNNTTITVAVIGKLLT